MFNGQPTVMVGARVPPPIEAEIDAICSRDGILRSEAVRRLIEFGLAIDKQLGRQKSVAA